MSRDRYVYDPAHPTQLIPYSPPVSAPWYDDDLSPPPLPPAVLQPERRPSAPRPSAPRGAPYASPQFAELVAPFAPTTSGSAIASFLFALLGLTLLPLLGQLISIILGHRALRKIKRSEGAIEGRWLARTGLILSYSALGLALCGFVALVLGFVALAAALTGQ